MYPECVFLVPRGDVAWFRRRGFKKVIPAQWYEQFNIAQLIPGKTGILTFLPAAHQSRRGFFDRNKSLWGSWMIKQANRLVYFAGDTAFGGHFQAIAQEFKNIDVALLPIGPGKPYDMMHAIHLDAQQALDAFSDLRARTLIPMHFGAYALGDEGVWEPVHQLFMAWQQRCKLFGDKTLCSLLPGQALSIK